MKVTLGAVVLGLLPGMLLGCARPASTERSRPRPSGEPVSKTSGANDPAPADSSAKEAHRRKEAEPASTDSEEAAALPMATGARCGAETCRGEKPTCCLESASGPGECMPESEVYDGCPIDGVHFQLRCGHPSDCPAGSRCCIYNQMSQCGVECAHLGQMCEKDEDCGALAAVTKQPAKCIPLEGGPTQFSVCQVE